MNKKPFFLGLILLSLSCSLYIDEDSPNIYFEYSDFEILELGRSVTDMIISSDQKDLFLSDYNNNSILKIKTNTTLSINNILIVGSHPIAMDLNSNNSILAVALEGESKIAIINSETMTLNAHIPITLMNVNDIVFVNDSVVIASSKTDPSCITINLNTHTITSQSVLNGELAMDYENKILYVATSSSVKKYNWDGTNFYQDSNVSDPYGFIGDVHHIVYNQAKNIILTCISDQEQNFDVRHVYSYFGTDMTFAGKYLINSPGLAVAISQDGERVFTAPTEADEIGVFIIEFEQSTKLETNYFLSAGNFTERGLAIDTNGEYLYSLVNIPGDDDSFEPYNDYSFDLQRISISN